MQLVYRGDR